MVAPYKWGPPRDDGRCGAAVSADCDANGAFPCCSPMGWCGNTPGHCDCMECTNFRAATTSEYVLVVGVY